MARPVIDEKQALDFSAMTVDQLLEEAQALATVLDLCNSQRLELFATIKKREADVKAKVSFEQMTEIEKDALSAALAPMSIAAVSGVKAVA